MLGEAMPESRPSNRQTLICKQCRSVLSRGGEVARTAIAALRQTVLHDQDGIVRQQAYHALNAIDPESTRGLPFPGFFRLPDD
jgi:hypothetical protein